MVKQRPSNYKKPIPPKRGRKNPQEWKQDKRKYRRKLKKWEGPKNKKWPQPSPNNPKASFKHLLAFLPSIGITLAATGVATLAALIVGAFLSESVHLSRIAPRMPMITRQRSRLRRLERWIDNKKVDCAKIMGPYTKWYFSQIDSQTIYIILDFTTKKDKFLIAMVSALQGKRTIPLYWKTGLANTKGVSRKALAHQALRQVAKWVPEGKQIIFIADREFYSTEYRKIISKELKWNFVLRLSADQTYMFFADGSPLPKERFTIQEREGKDGKIGYYCHLNKLEIKEGEAYYFTGIRLTLKKDGPYQIAAVWDKGAKEAWLIVSDLPDPTILPKIYAKRWAIESTFRDLKSYGFNLEASRIKDIERFDRLLIGVTLAYGWAARIGHLLDQSGQRHLVDRGTKDKLSVYRMGRDWLLHLWDMGDLSASHYYFGNVRRYKEPDYMR